jgi:hypothetical protein
VKKYSKDYIVDSQKIYKGNKLDEIQYTGDYYVFQLNTVEYKKMRIIILEYLIFLTVLYVTGGMLNNSGSFCVYVLLPYICIILPLSYLGRSYIRIPKEIKKMEYVIYDKCYNRVKFSIVGIITASITTVIGDVIFILRNMMNIIILKEVIFCIINVCIVVTSILLLQYHNRIVCEKQ